MMCQSMIVYSFKIKYKVECNFWIFTKHVNPIDKFIYRAMAVSISMCFARFGSAFGSNIVAFLLENNCQVAFYMSGISLIGKVSSCQNLFQLDHFKND